MRLPFLAGCGVLPRALWSAAVFRCCMLGQPATPSDMGGTQQASFSRPAVFLLELRPGTGARITVEQLNGDAAIRVSRKGGTEREVDGFEFGREYVTIESTAEAATYVFEARPLEKQGAVVVRFASEVEPATHTHRERRAAEDASTLAKKVLDKSGNNQEVTPLLESATRAWEALKEHSAAARTRWKLAVVYRRAGLAERARLQALAARTACSLLQDLRCRAETSNTVALANMNLGDVEPAFAEFQTSVEVWGALGLPPEASTTLMNQALLYWQVGEFQSALEGYEAALRLLLKANDPLTHARTLNNLGLVYLSMAEYDKAAAYFVNALRAAPFIPSFQRDIGRFRMNLGRARMLGGKLGLANVNYQRARSVLEQADDPVGLADTNNNIGQLLLRSRSFVQAKTAFDRAMKTYEATRNLRGQSSVLHYLGQLAMERGDFAQARTLFRQALEIRETRRMKDEAAETLYRLAWLERRTGHTGEACRLIERAIDYTEELLLRVQGKALRRPFFASKQVYYGFLMETLISAGTGEGVRRALEVSEQARGRALIDAVADTQRLRADPAVVLQQRAIRRQIRLKSAQLAGLEESAGVEMSLRDQLDFLLAEDGRMQSLMSSGKSSNSSSIPTRLNADQIQGLLGPRDLLLEYFVGEARSWVWVVSRNSIRAHALPNAEALEGLARKVLAPFEQAKMRKIDSLQASEFKASLVELAQALGMAFVGERFERLVVIPDGILNRVPFAALPTGRAALGLQYDLVQASSASNFKIFRERRAAVRATQPTVAAFVDPVFSGEDSRAVGARGAQGVADYYRLGFSQIEAEAIEALVPSPRAVIMRGFQANREAFLAKGTWRSSLVLASTHSIVDDAMPELSSIILSGIGEDGKAVDNQVRLYDVLDLQIQSSLVVLSLCRAAHGTLVRGEGLFSLSAGFATAGASGLLAPIQNVDAESSAELVSAFLRGVLSLPGMSPARALRSARAKLAKSPRFADPYYWSGFVLTSSWE